MTKYVTMVVHILNAVVCKFHYLFGKKIKIKKKMFAFMHALQKEYGTASF